MFEGRSQFFNLPLLGVGTPATESLRSYIYRLSMAHRLRPKALLTELLAKHGAQSAISNLNDMFKSMNIHGDGGRAKRLLRLFAESTGVDLGLATMGRFLPVLSTKHLVRTEGYYCPECVREEVSGDGGSFPHGQLLWEVDCVRACPMHGIRLRRSKVCGAAANDKLPLNKRPQLSPVSHSCASIGFGCVDDAPEEASASELWVARQVGRLVSLPPSVTDEFSRERLQAGIKALAEARFGRSTVDAAVGAELSRNLVWYWANTDTPPSLPLLLQLCASCGADPLALLEGRFEPGADVAPGPIRLVKRDYQRMTMTVEELRAAVEQAGSETPPPSAKSVARRLGVSERRMRVLVPDELAILVERNTMHRQQQEERTFQATVGAYEAAAQALVAEGKTVGAKYLQKRAGLVAYSHNRNRQRALEGVIAKYRRPS